MSVLRQYVNSETASQNQNTENSPVRTIHFRSCRSKILSPGRNLIFYPSCFFLFRQDDISVGKARTKRGESCFGDSEDDIYVVYRYKANAEDVSRLHLPYSFILHRGAKFLDIVPHELHKEVQKIDIEIEKLGALGKECKTFMEDIRN